MFRLVELWRQSGQTKKAFREDHQISEKSFRYWVKKYENADSTGHQGSFVALEVEKNGIFQQEIQISYPNGVRMTLQMHPGMNITTLRTLITLL